jgi:hypothetical protein
VKVVVPLIDGSVWNLNMRCRPPVNKREQFVETTYNERLVTDGTLLRFGERFKAVPVLELSQGLQLEPPKAVVREA